MKKIHFGNWTLYSGGVFPKNKFYIWGHCHNKDNSEMVTSVTIHKNKLNFLDGEYCMFCRKPIPKKLKDFIILIHNLGL